MINPQRRELQHLWPNPGTCRYDAALDAARHNSATSFACEPIAIVRGFCKLQHCFYGILVNTLSHAFDSPSKECLRLEPCIEARVHCGIAGNAAAAQHGFLPPQPVVQHMIDDPSLHQVLLQLVINLHPAQSGNILAGVHTFLNGLLLR